MKKVAVITGASSGIGFECRKFLKQNGYEVVNISRSNEENVENHFECDISNFEKLQEVFAKIEEKFEKVDLLINCAGYGISGALELSSNEQVEKIFDVNVIGLLNCSKLCLKLMDKGSKIVNISSTCALFALPFRAVYCATKSAVNMLSYGMRMELKQFGIDVVCICPGEIKSNFSKNRIKRFATNEKYGERIENASRQIDAHEEKRMSVEKAGVKIGKICLKKHSKPMYIVGKKYKVFNFFQKILPVGMFLFFIEKIFGGHKKY